MRSWRTRGKFQAKIGRTGDYLCRGQWGLVTGVRKLGLCSRESRGVLCGRSVDLWGEGRGHVAGEIGWVNWEAGLVGTERGRMLEEEVSVLPGQL